MTKQLTEKEFIDMFSEEEYQKISLIVFEQVQKSPEFKNNEPDVYTLAVLPLILKNENNKEGSLIIEATCHKKDIGDKLTAYDFGIVQIAISDEEMPDIALDKYNLMKKSIEDEKNKKK